MEQVKHKLTPATLVKESELRAVEAAGRRPQIVSIHCDCGCEIRWQWEGNAPALEVDFCHGHRVTENADTSWGRTQIATLAALRRQAEALAGFFESKVDEISRLNGIVEHAKARPKFIPFQVGRKHRR